MLGFALVAFGLRLANFPLAPMLLGFILSGMLEDNLRRTLYIADGSLSILIERPITLVLTCLCVAVWVVPIYRKHLR